MAVSPPSPLTLETKPENSEPENPTAQPSQPNPSSSSSESPSLADNSNSADAAAPPPLLPPQYFAPPPSLPPGSASPFRPVPNPPQFSQVPNSSPNPNVQSHGVSIALPGSASGGAGSVSLSVLPIRGLHLRTGMPPDPAVFALSMASPMVTGLMLPQGTILPPGCVCYYLD